MGKNQWQATVYGDFSPHIDAARLSIAVNNIINQNQKYERTGAILSKEHYGRVLVKINGVEYLLANDDCNFKELKDAIGYCDMYDGLVAQKNDGIKQGRYHEPSTHGIIPEKRKPLLQRLIKLVASFRPKL